MTRNLADKIVVYNRIRNISLITSLISAVLTLIGLLTKQSTLEVVSNTVLLIGIVVFLVIDGKINSLRNADKNSDQHRQNKETPLENIEPPKRASEDLRDCE